MKKKIELLSPAGDLERLKIALLYGADAVYIGGREYSLRANATNISIEEIKEACSFAHKLGKKVYQTVNIVFHNEDIAGIYDYLKEAVDAGIDAFIVSDPFIISYIRKNFPQVEVHVSTQNSTTNIETVKFFQKEGVARVVPARELSKEEIKELVSTGCDIEVFIHGAMCTFFSGRCTLSNYVTNRDSNRGGCSQVCRFVFNIDSNDEHKFTMATKDLNMAEHIKELIDIGVASLKVEGRMRSHYYLATVISSYRKIIDACYSNTLTNDLIKQQEKILSRVANRETSTHYFNHLADETDQYYTGRQELSNQDYLAYVLSYDDNTGMVTISERNYFEPGTEVEIFMPSGKVISFIIDKIYDNDMNELEKAYHPEEILKIKVPDKVEEHSMMRIKVK
ncbi:MAG: U32 family peptidase [Tenericutes bacterium]|nr:U32 family peptidase [Mycoplasmatota bacterium]